MKTNLCCQEITDYFVCRSAETDDITFEHSRQRNCWFYVPNKSFYWTCKYWGDRAKCCSKGAKLDAKFVSKLEEL